MRDRPFDDVVADMLRRDPDFKAKMLDNILADGDQAELLIALRQMTKAFGGVPAVAEKANLNATQLYRTLSEEGNPAISSLTAVLKVMGLRLGVQPLARQQSR